MGEVPDWFLHLRAARYLGVAPWELSEQAVFWRNAALTAANVDAAMDDYHTAKSKRKKGR